MHAWQRQACWDQGRSLHILRSGSLHSCPVWQLEPVLHWVIPCRSTESTAKRCSLWHWDMQVFVANPNKTPEIVDVLANNKEKLLKYLGDFHTEKGALRCLFWHAIVPHSSRPLLFLALL